MVVMVTSVVTVITKLEGKLVPSSWPTNSSIAKVFSSVLAANNDGVHKLIDTGAKRLCKARESTRKPVQDVAISTINDTMV